METTSQTLLERVRDPHDAQAWETFVAIYTPLLHAWAKRLPIAGQEPGDLVQDIFAVLVRTLPQFEYDPDGGFRKWLKTVVSNRWKDLVARRAPTVDGRLIDDAAAADANEDFWERDHDRWIVRSVLRRVENDFQARTWRLFWRNVMDERAADDVAAEFGVARHLVYDAKHRVLKRLREELRGLLD